MIEQDADRDLESDTSNHAFDKNYWDQHYQSANHQGSAVRDDRGPNPYLIAETAGLLPGSALDAGCGEGAEAIWLAAHGWRVTAADIAADALTRASARLAGTDAAAHVHWVEADLSIWEPNEQFDLVTTHYAHPAIPQLDFYERIATWVAPGGTLLIVGHLHSPRATGHEHHPPAEASATLASILERLSPSGWRLVTADEHVRTLTGRHGEHVYLNDVVVRANRHP